MITIQLYQQFTSIHSMNETSLFTTMVAQKIQ